MIGRSPQQSHATDDHRCDQHEAYEGGRSAGSRPVSDHRLALGWTTKIFVRD